MFDWLHDCALCERSRCGFPRWLVRCQLPVYLALLIGSTSIVSDCCQWHEYLFWTTIGLHVCSDCNCRVRSSVRSPTGSLRRERGLCYVRSVKSEIKRRLYSRSSGVVSVLRVIVVITSLPCTAHALLAMLASFCKPSGMCSTAACAKLLKLLTNTHHSSCARDNSA